MMFLSDFADQAVMLPLAAVVLVVLGVIGWWRGLASWAVAVGGTFVVVATLKIGFYAAAAAFGAAYQISPSGHVASACMVYGGLAALLLQGRASWPVIASIPVIVGLVIGYTRVDLGMHSLVEVCIGAAIGLTGAALLAVWSGPRPRFAAWPLMAAGCATVVTLHGMHLQAEEAIQFAAVNW